MYREKQMRFFAGLLLALGAACLSPQARAQDFPNKPVTIVVPFAPGASNDIFARFLAEALAKEWKQPVQVENRGGGGGAIGMARMIKSKADGYTLVFGSSSLAVSGAALKDLPYDPLADVQPVSMVATGHLVMVTGNRIPLKTVADIVREAKVQKIFYGSNGAGLPSFGAELLNEIAGIKMENVNYKGASEALVDLVGGRLDLYVGDAPTMAPQILDKKVTGVATLATARLKVLPDMPTIAEAGFPRAQMAIWWGVFAPAGTPKDVLEKINDGIKKVMASPEGADFLDKNSATQATTTVDDFVKRYRDDPTQFKAIAKSSNLAAPN
jgi:tripartite-type tricarboxylate transporter receptor subunit TctC